VPFSRSVVSLGWRSRWYDRLHYDGEATRDRGVAEVTGLRTHARTWLLGLRRIRLGPLSRAQHHRHLPPNPEQLPRSEPSKRILE
jgi:hypothetical protein